LLATVPTKMANVAEREPALTITDPGTESRPLSLEIEMTTPPAGAAG